MANKKNGAFSDEQSPELLEQIKLLDTIVKERNQLIERKKHRAFEWLNRCDSTSQMPQPECPPEALLERCAELMAGTHPRIAQQALGVWASLLLLFLESKLPEAPSEACRRPLRFISSAMIALGKGTAVPVFEPSRVNGRHDTWNEAASAKFKAMCVLASDELLIAARSETKRRLPRASADKLICEIAKRSAQDNGIRRLTPATLKNWRDLCRGKKDNTVKTHSHYLRMLINATREKFGPVTSAEMLLTRLAAKNAEKPLLFRGDQLWDL